VLTVLIIAYACAPICIVSDILFKKEFICPSKANYFGITVNPVGKNNPVAFN